MKTKYAVALMVLALALISNALAQDTAAQASASTDPAELGKRSATVHQTCVDQLKRYSWNIDSMLSKDGEAKIHVVANCRLNEKGELVQEVEKAETSVRHKRGLRGRAQSQKLNELSILLDHIVDQMVTYTYMSTDEESAFFKKATITEGSGDDAGKLIVKATDVSTKGDKVTKWIDATSLYPTRITFEAVVDEVPVDGEVLYRPIEGGPNVPRMATINIPSEKGVIEAEFLDYAKQL